VEKMCASDVELLGKLYLVRFSNRYFLKNAKYERLSHIRMGTMPRTRVLMCWYRASRA
jgi:hypothetical protein